MLFPIVAQILNNVQTILFHNKCFNINGIITNKQSIIMSFKLYCLDNVININRGDRSFSETNNKIVFPEGLFDYRIIYTDCELHNN